MKNGTYSEALEAGFTVEQAGVFARACIDIKNECWEHIQKEQKKRTFYARFLGSVDITVITMAIVFMVGMMFGFIVNEAVSQF